MQFLIADLFRSPVPIITVHAFLRAGLILALFFVTLVASSIPFLLRRIQINSPNFLPLLSLVSVFGGGVFLATCLLDLLPDANDCLRKVEEMQHFTYSYPFVEVFIAVGFLLVLFTEQVVLSIREKHALDNGDMDQLITGHNDYVSSSENDGDSTDIYSEHESSSRNSQDPQQSHTTVRVVLLVMALSLHAVFEGLSLGLIGDVNEILQVFLALLIHKTIIGFSLGLRLAQSSLRTATILLSAVIFSGQVILGGFGGIAILDFISYGSPHIAGIVSTIAQAVACGTFLYVTCFEILPHEFNKPSYRISKLLILTFGFVLIACLVKLFPNG
ncbi:unnamed protein product [Thelazia callipaeda]|uniref:Zinc transporter ZIP1 n=1 Tax=Thelazia callipaeda TaxID=103827 RepID=A0A0N5CSC2_THECL|nr:unnamed protein product [Thelazia callipaeda]